MTNDDVGEFVTDAFDALEGDLSAVSAVLVERAYALGSTDNMSALVVNVNSNAGQPPA